MEPMAKCRRVLFPDKKKDSLPSSSSKLNPLPFEEDNENGLASVLETMRGIVAHQRQEVIRFSEDLLGDCLFTTQREALVQWMTEVCSLLAALPATLHLSVALLDARFFHAHPPKSKYQLIAASAMLVAAKFYECINDNPLDHQTLAHFTDDCYSPREILMDEAFLLQSIHFTIHILTPCCFLSLITESLAFRPGDRLQGQKVEQGYPLRRIRKRVTRKAGYFASMTLHAYGFRKYLPQDIAASCLAASRNYLGIQPVWSVDMERLSGSEFAKFQPCYFVILNAHQRFSAKF